MNIFLRACFARPIIGAAVLMLLVTIGCGNERDASNAVKPPTIEGILRQKKMRVGYVRFSPCADINPNTQQLEGIFIDSIREVAADLKVEVEFKETTLSTFAAALNAREFDFSVGPTFITPGRATAVRFTRPLLTLGNSGLVRKERAGEFVDPRALGAPGLRVAVLQGQAMEQFMRSRYPGSRLLVISGSDLTAPLLAVEAGQADVGLTNSVTVQQFASRHSGTVPVFTEEGALVRLGLAWVTRADDEPLQSFLNSSIEWLVQSGKLDKIQDKYEIKLSAVN